MKNKKVKLTSTERHESIKRMDEDQRMRALANLLIDRALEEWEKSNSLNLNNVSNNNMLIMEH